MPTGWPIVTVGGPHLSNGTVPAGRSAVGQRFKPAAGRPLVCGALRSNRLIGWNQLSGALTSAITSTFKSADVPRRARGIGGSISGTRRHYDTSRPCLRQPLYFSYNRGRARRDASGAVVAGPARPTIAAAPRSSVTSYPINANRRRSASHRPVDRRSALGARAQGHCKPPL